MTADFKFHPLAGIFPLMKGAEFDALVADIKANGLLEPIVTYEGMILDGRNRYRACLAAGWTPLRISYQILTSGKEGEGDLLIDNPAAYVISTNIRRRHLTPKQKRDLIARLIKAAPEKSNRQIASAANVDHKTVAAVRAEKQSTGEIPQLKKTVGKDGKARTRPKAKPEAKTKTTLPKHDSRIIAPKLADRVGRFAHDLILSERLLARELADIIMLPGVRERLAADLTNGLALMGNDADDLEHTL
jgi:hypothetical protein